MEKRYQHWTREGIKWTPWFEWTSSDCPNVQLKGFKGNDLLNEYR